MIRRFGRSESGTSLVEFALTAPMLIFFVIGLIEMGRYETMAMMCAHAARAGVQYGGQTTFTAADTAGMTSAAVQDGQTLSTWHVTPSYFCMNSGAVVSCPTGVPSSSSVYYVQVKVTGTFNSMLKYPGIPSSVALSETATMRVLRQ
ncbi:MAG TPA: TadE/TadG family type IV pilus assembly protein [Candidatus Cybelea sp.]|nr:TadE/TadG family type IV pilus assembly protein [Candidatus Cybelea sp.]